MIRTLIAGLTAATLSLPAAMAGEWKPLLDATDLSTLLEEDTPVIFDIRSPSAYAEGHVEGAVNVPYNAWRGPEENPGALISDEKLSLLLSEAGVEPDVPVVVTYAGKGTLDFGSAARVYWTLKSAGVEQIAILNGGIAAWTAAGEALSTTEGSNFPSDLAFTFAETWKIDRAGVAEAQEGLRTAQLVDARPEAFFTGVERHDAAGWAGTLTGAISLVHETWFGGPVLTADRASVLAALDAAGVDRDGAPIVSFCNTGHWAATNWFVLSEIAGIDGVKLYPESMVGWTRHSRKVAHLAE